jgi:hypothetical protein
MDSLPQPVATVYDNGVELRSPWHNTRTPSMVEALKAQIPAPSRSYSPADKMWFVAAAYVHVALAIFDAHWPGARVVYAHKVYGGQGRDSTPPPRSRPPLARDHHYAVLCVTPAAPPEIVRAAYRAWCKLAHPDALPASERDAAHRRMVEINGAYEALQSQGAA